MFSVLTFVLAFVPRRLTTSYVGCTAKNGSFDRSIVRTAFWDTGRLLQCEAFVDLRWSAVSEVAKCQRFLAVLDFWLSPPCLHSQKVVTWLGMCLHSAHNVGKLRHNVSMMFLVDLRLWFSWISCSQVAAQCFNDDVSCWLWYSPNIFFNILVIEIYWNFQ